MRWMERAWSELGQSEIKGGVANEQILQYFKAVGHDNIKSDEIAWCAAFLGAVLEWNGFRSTRSLMARSYEKWGYPSEPREGAIVVLKRTNDPRFGHVGFCVSFTDDLVTVIGGNQGNSVSVREFARDAIVAWRWPEPLDGDGKMPASSVNERSWWDLALTSRTIKGALYSSFGGLLIYFEQMVSFGLQMAQTMSELSPIKSMLAMVAGNVPALGLGLLVWGGTLTFLRRVVDEKERIG